MNKYSIFQEPGGEVMVAMQHRGEDGTVYADLVKKQTDEDLPEAVRRARPGDIIDDDGNDVEDDEDIDEDDDDDDDEDEDDDTDAEADARSLETGTATPVIGAGDEKYRKILLAVQAAFTMARRLVTKGALKSRESAEALVPKIERALKSSLKRVLEPVLLDTALAGAKAAQLPRLAAKKKAPKPALNISAVFGKENKEARAWAKKHAGELIDGLSKTSVQRIRSAIADGFDEEADTDEIFERIVKAVGDEDRAERIAHHESMMAASEGQRMAWDHAISEGWLSEDDERQWIAASDACPLCQELNGKTAPLKGEYPEPGGEGPPLHVGCRCSEGIAIPEAQ